MKRHYGFWNLLLDVTLTLLSGGFWLLWVIVREAIYLNKKV